MNTRLFGVMLTYLVGFTAILNMLGLAAFPPPSITIPVNLIPVVSLIPNLGFAVTTLSWFDLMFIISTISIGAIVVVNLLNTKLPTGAGLDLDVQGISNAIIGVAFCGALGLSLYLMVTGLIPTWIQLFIVYVPVGLLMYSIFNVGGD